MKLLLYLLFISICYPLQLYAKSQDNVSVAIDPSKIIAPVNRLILGNNLIPGKRSSDSSYLKSSGRGVWDPINDKANSEAINLIKMAGVSVLRWPGGNWPKTLKFSSLVGPRDSRPDHVFGLPEFLKLCQDVKAIPLITLPTDEAKLSEIPDLVEYLDAPDDGSNPNGGIDWAHMRTNDGRKAPWGVTWFEFGNETFNTDISAKKYISNYLKAYGSMKSINPAIKLGAVLDDTDVMHNGWSDMIIRGVGNKADFLSFHPYFPRVRQSDLKIYSLDTLALSALASDGNFLNRVNGYNALIKNITHRMDLKLVASEYNGQFVQQKPVPLRFSLVNAIHNADMVRLMLDPKLNIQMANYWSLNDTFWGMIQQDKMHRGKFYKQANYYVYELYNNYLGDNLVFNKIDSPSFEFAGAGVVSARTGLASTSIWTPYAGKIPNDWKLRWFEKGVDQEQSNGIVTVNFNSENVNYNGAYKIIRVKPNTLYRVDVKVKTANISGGKVGIAITDARGWGKTHYEPKNIQMTGTSQWQWVSDVIKTLPDTKAIKIMGRRIGGKGSRNITGKVYFGETRVMENSSNLGAAGTIVGLASLSKNKKSVYVVLINKDMNKGYNANIAIPNTYKAIQSESLVGKSAYSMNMPVGTESVKLVKSTWDYGSGITKIHLQPLSVTGIKFVEK